MEEEKAKLISLKRRKKTLVSKSGKGVVIRKPEKKDPDSPEDTSQEKEGSGALLPYKKEVASLLRTELPEDESQAEDINEEVELDLDQIEKDLAEVGKNRTFIQKLIGIDPEGEEIEHLEKVLKKLQLRIEVRAAASTLIRQQHELERNLLEAQTSLLQKKALSQFAVQKMINEIELEKLAIEKAKAELEKLELQKEVEELRRQLQAWKKHQGEEYDYSLKDLDALEKSPDTESDD